MKATIILSQNEIEQAIKEFVERVAYKVTSVNLVIGDGLVHYAIQAEVEAEPKMNIREPGWGPDFR